MSIAYQIGRLQYAKREIKTAIEGKGVAVPSSTLISGYATLIDSIEQGGDTDGLSGFLSVESKTIATSASTTVNIAYNKHCGILDENGKKWDTLEWHQRWVDNSYSASGLSAPVGIWMEAFGLDDIVYLWPIQNSSKYWDVSGSQESNADVFRHFMYENDAIYVARSGDAYPATVTDAIAHGTAGKYNASAWSATVDGDGLIMYSANTKESFRIPSRDVANANAFMKDNAEDYLWSYYQQCLFYRACFAICSGVSTTENNGATTTVSILNSSGQQAAVNEDMYFWIGSTNTGLKAKYNLNSRLVTNASTGQGTAYYLTQAIADAIYAKQIAAGINMNDTGVNSSSKKILTDGALGATAVAVDGFWYIKTPYISRPSNTTWNNDWNMPDAPASFICKLKGVSINTERRLYPYWLNKTTIITGIVNMLRNNEGLSTSVPAVISGNLWSGIRYGASTGWYVSASNGNVNVNNTFVRYYVVPVPSVAF